MSAQVVDCEGRKGAPVGLDRTAPISHDRLFKRTFKDFYPELLDLFCPDWLRRCDLSDVKFLDKELLNPDLGAAPQDRDTEADLAVLMGVMPVEPMLPGLGEDVVERRIGHIEVQEGSGSEPIGKRVFEYNYGLRREHGPLVLSMLVWFGAGHGGIGDDEYREDPLGDGRWTLRFRYRRVGVRGLDAREYLGRGNVLGYALAARMDRGGLSRAELRVRCEQRIAGAGLSAGRSLLLINCVRTYLVLSIEEEREYRALRESAENREIKTMELTWDEQMWYAAEDRGEERGEKKAERRMFREVWEMRFGPMADEFARRLAGIDDLGRLQKVRRALLRATSLDEAIATLT